MNLTEPPVFVEGPDQISVAALGRGIWRSRALIMVTMLIVGAAGLTHAVFRRTTYTATAWFRPQSQPSQTQSIAGLASQFGLVLPLGGSGMTPQAYADLATSREVLRPVSLSSYTYQDGGKAVTSRLVDIYSSGAAPLEQRVDGTVGLLTRQVNTTVSKTGAIALRVTTAHPELSKELAASIIDQIDSLNLRTQQGRATPERVFIEQRLTVAQDELRQAEDRLTAFLEANRQIATPQLQLDRDRLSRDVAMRQQLYTSLVDAYQRARIDEVRDMPAITVLEDATLPYAPDSRRIGSTTALALALGLVLGLFLAFIRDTWRSLRRVADAESVTNESGADSVSHQRMPLRPGSSPAGKL